MKLYRKNNIFTINENRGIKAIGVDIELFELIKEALALYDWNGTAILTLQWVKLSIFGKVSF